MAAWAGPMDSYNMKRGLDAMKQGDNNEALKYFYQETVDNPSNGYAAFYVGYLCHLDGGSNRVGAFRYAKMASELLPKNEKQMISVSLLIMEKTYEIAEDTVMVKQLNERIKRVSPEMASINTEQTYTIKDLPYLMKLAAENQNGHVFMNLINLCDSSNYRQVLDSLDRRIASDPQNHWWALAADDIAANQRLYRESFEYAKKALAIHPTAFGYSHLASTALNHFSNAELAEACIQRAIAIDSSNISIYLSQEDLYMETGRAAEAFEAAEKALRIDPSRSGIYYLRGMVHFVRHEYEEAAEELLKAMLVDPEGLEHMFRIAEMYRLAGDTAKQHYYLREGVRLRQSSGKELDKEAYIALGDTVKARELCFAEKIEDKSPQQEYNLACAFARINETDAAMLHLRRAIDYGFLNLYHFTWDDDLESLRQLPEFMELLATCKEKVESLKDITL